MNRLTDAADQYLKSCTWRDLALLKICVCALGVLIGLALPGRKKRRAAWAASLVFAAAYIPLMGRFCPSCWGSRCPLRIFTAENGCKISGNGVS